MLIENWHLVWEGWKTLREKEKMLVTSIFSFSHNVFKRLPSRAVKRVKIYSINTSLSQAFFMPPHRKIGGILFYCCPSIHLSVRLSVCTNLTWKLNIFPLHLNYYSCKAHIWYKGTFHWYTSLGIKVKVICKGQGQISGSCFSKDGYFGGISVSQTHLVYFILQQTRLKKFDKRRHYR